MARFHGKRVSRKWARVLRHAERDGVKFLLTSGRRTMREQWALYRNYQAGRGPVAAYPSPNAPHIRVGRANHAVDINALDGGEARLERWVQRQGVDWQNTVPGEAWHGEVSAAGLRKLNRLAKKDLRRRKRRRRKRRN